MLDINERWIKLFGNTKALTYEHLLIAFHNTSIQPTCATICELSALTDLELFGLLIFVKKRIYYAFLMAGSLWTCQIYNFRISLYLINEALFKYI